MWSYLNQRTGAVTLSVMSNTLLIVLKLSVGFYTHSVGVISEAIHSTTDLVAALIAFVAIRQAARPADANHPYGHAKAESLAAAIEAQLIFLAAGMIIYEAVQRLVFGAYVENIDWGVAVMLVSSAVNFLVSRHLFSVARRTESPALTADAWHLSTDLLTALGVGIGLFIVRVTGIASFDPLIAIGVALFIVKAAWDISRGSVADLMDESLPPEEEARIRAVLDRRRDQFSNVRVMRTRRAGGARRIYVALEFPPTVSLADAHTITEDLERQIKGIYPAAHVVVEPEAPADAEKGDSTIKTVERVARREGLPVHHIQVIDTDDRVTIALHLEVDSSLSLEQAHAQANRLESELRREVPGLVQIQTHIEPVRRQAVPHHAALGARERVLQDLEEMSRDEPALQGLHDVQVLDDHGKLAVTVHLALQGDVAIDEAHRIGSEVENRLRQEMPEVQSVLVHTEPVDQA